jgi:hypothetical protein
MVPMENDMVEQSRGGLILDHLAAHRFYGKVQPGSPEQLCTPGTSGDHNPVSVVFTSACPDPLKDPSLRNHPQDGRVLVNCDTVQLQ